MADIDKANARTKSALISAMQEVRRQTGEEPLNDEELAQLFADESPKKKWIGPRRSSSVLEDFIEETYRERYGLKQDPGATASLAQNLTAIADANSEIERLRAEVEQLKAELAQGKGGESLADHPNWPEELDISITAWRAAVNGAAQSGRKPGAFLRDWLRQNYGTLKEEQIKRIAIVANWDKTPGPK
ncbi:hypothetical protein HHL24_17005 [Paraburkholderia sp. RP-4-7]|uniref:Uncharacterized protein n=1 Tax=Paraburkholderia polaris TaxID=2728848 RepID=A0A848IHC9_9BURK|nr:hypothetical protein [Paraburkholderia polaris]NML99628.1 hypothetical protein [Paraburkholderia polaris]